jgi:pyruvate-formate lyase-activating enzyme
MQAEFCRLLLEKLKVAGIHTCVETSGHVDETAFIRTEAFTDLYLYDFKMTDPVLHRKYTGKDNTRILSNLELLHGLGKRIILRCPVVPGIHDNKAHLDGIVALYGHFHGDIPVELMPYHMLGLSKLERFGICNDSGMPNHNAPDAVIMECEEYLKGKGVALYANKANT